MANNKWTPVMEQYVIDNIDKGWPHLMDKFSVTLLAIKKKANLLGLRTRVPAVTPQEKRKPDNAEKFAPNRHRILNSDITGKIAVWVPSERMTIYCKPGADVQAVVDKFVNRHKGGFA